MRSVFFVAVIIVLMAIPASAAVTTGSWIMDQSNTFADGTPYGQVGISADTSTGIVSFSVDAFELGIYGTLSNFGIDKFGFNYANITNPGSIVFGGLPTDWSVYGSSAGDGFGYFFEMVESFPSNVQDTLTFNITLPVASFAEAIASNFAVLSTGYAGQGNVFFSAHVRGFESGLLDDELHEIQSHWIGGSIPISDTDLDGVPDNTDNCPLIPNVDQADADTDGVGNVCDICPGFDDNIDLDSDGVPDACDVCPNDPANDADGDGICGDVDNCPYMNNPGQADVRPAGGDGIGDACQNDYDGDGVNDNLDNCPATPNPTQLDTDTDLRGDACDLCPLDPTDACAGGEILIGPEGGTVTNGAGTASVDIPAGALAEEVTISIIGETDISNYAVGRNKNTLEVGYIYTFDPNDQTFAVPITITLVYPQNNMPECLGVEANMDIYYYDVAGWVAQGATQDCAANTLTLVIDHFSDYVAIVIRDSDGDEVLDPSDNCPYVYNDVQTDSDADGIGDACECSAANIDTIDPVDLSDLAILALYWTQTIPDLAGDTNRDDSVDLGDLQQLIQHWQESCSP